MIHETEAAQVESVAGTAAAAERLLVVCDFDGTLSPIVGDPAAARPLPGGTAALASLASLAQTHVAALSGRSRRDLALLLGPVPGVMLIGSHGAEWGTDLGESLTEDQVRLLRTIVKEAAGIIEGVDGAHLEKKPASVAVHVRRAARPDASRVLAAVDEGPARRPGVVVIHGKEVVELSVVHETKGTAVARLKELFQPSLTLYFGDDVTDEHAFASLSDDDIGLRVGPGPSLATVRLAGPPDVVGVLSAIVQRRRAVLGRGPR